MEEETLSKKVQEKLAIRLLGKQIPIMGYKNGKYQVIDTVWDSSSQRLRVLPR